ncbi:hypothetical protein D7V97_10840 [Corallococcus sp. CA053C]|nr:hypothetical protein D7V97_10840 [Corallococcus sp. CA053C]
MNTCSPPTDRRLPVPASTGPGVRQLAARHERKSEPGPPRGSLTCSHLPLQTRRAQRGKHLQGADGNRRSGLWAVCLGLVLAAGQGHSLAVKSDGTVWAWGDNSNGQLGHGIPAFARVPERSLLLP